MSVKLTTKAESYAEKAENLPAFVGIKLLDIKQKVAELLDHIGKEGFFRQYTKHDISHIDGMLDILDWLIPQNTQEIMSPADWLLLVLAIYFHDLGMIVTKKEYDSRNLSGFPEYCDNFLFSGDDGKDYRARVEQHYPDPDEAEQFLYQEFVRHNHAERIGMWINGQAPVSFGVTSSIVLEVHKPLEPLKPIIRRDLALICESHHLDDLDNFKKYNVSQPYRGNSKEETANLQYIAALLRTTDLLHITSDRTPSITFRLINPTDPMSQLEWAKQAAVNSVRPKVAYDRDGKPDAKAINDTIEVHAYYLDQTGFFGLTSYLPWVAEQLDQTHAWVKEANDIYGTSYTFPWRYIDDSHVDSKGFIRGKFGFEIDQKRILNLLTGYTLYNDTNVVIRELVQNSLDAIRLQHVKEPTSRSGKVEIHWDSKNRVLCVKDNGTGMTFETIENHFLKVGVSLYQDEKFQKQYPDFTSISRFGIGVLSTFMIADAVEVTTCHPEEPLVRKISMRSVHGKYLIQSLDKDTDEVARSLVPHGTLIKLNVRKSADRDTDEFNVVEAAQRWIVVPNCDVSVTVDENPPIQVGFSSPKKAVEYILQKMGLSVDDISIAIKETEMQGVTLAYALKYSKYFQEWSFLQPILDRLSDKDKVLLGTCVEGVRVVFDTPGFDGNPIVALANAVGRNAPRTNVARSGLEATGRDKLLQTLYSIYCNHIKEEMQKLHEERSFSLTWATQESSYLLYPLIGGSSVRDGSIKPLNSNLLMESIRKLPALLIERKGRREVVSTENLRTEPHFWTIDCPLFDSAESIIREVQSEASLSDLIDALHTDYLQLPDEPLLCGFDDYSNLKHHVFEGKEVEQIAIYREQRRVDLRWTDQRNPPRWFQLNEILPTSRSTGKANKVHIVKDNSVEILGLKDEEIGVFTSKEVFLLSDSLLAKYLLSQLNQALNERTEEFLDRLDTLLLTVYLIISRGHFTVEGNMKRYFNNYLSNMFGIRTEDIKDFYEKMDEMNFRCFNPYAWQRSGYEDVNINEFSF